MLYLKKFLAENKKKTSFYFQALLKKFYLMTSPSGKTLTDQIVEQYVRAILVITVITEYSTVTTKMFFKVLIFFFSSHFLIFHLLSC